MPELQKITAFLPSELLDAAMAVTGEGLTETLRSALRRLNHHAVSQRLLAARGKVMFESDWRALRGKDEERSLSTPASSFPFFKAKQIKPSNASPHS